MTNDTVLTMPVEPAYGGRNNGGDDMFGGNGAWWIIVLFLFLWGRNGWGNGNGGDNGGGSQGYDTRADIQRSFDNSAVITKLDGITQGICDSTYALNNAITNGFNNTNMGMMQGFNGVDRAICNLQAQIAACCCETREAIQGVNYNLATNTCALQNTIQNTTRDILDNQNANSRAILDFLTQDRIAQLQSENQSLKLSASQANQNAVLMAAMDANTAELLRRTGHDCPTAAYIVQPPTPVSFPACGQPYGYNYGCGSCGCNS